MLFEVNFTDNPLIIELASELRSIHDDTIDCLIFATAMCNCDCLLTMDGSLMEKIKENIEILERIQTINKHFKFWLDDASDNPINL